MRRFRGRREIDSAGRRSLSSAWWSPSSRSRCAFAPVCYWRWVVVHGRAWGSNAY